MKNNQNIKDILAKNIWIKDYKLYHIIIALSVLVVVSCFIPLKSSTDTSILIGTQQALFLILSAILFVFHDSIIGYKSISKLRNDIEKLSSQDIKRKILQYVNIPEQSANYDEFLTTIDKEMFEFAKEANNFKQKSYKLYVVFAVFGLVAIVLSLINITLSPINIDFLNYSFSINISEIILNFCIYSQVFLIFVWVVSAFQAEKQKIQTFSFVSIKNIKQNIKDYIDSKNQKEIEFDMS
ncbi:MAG: hypothetical protein DRG11_03970 [Epsilonproteobacteria bacterium]|nr:MAG: hypothetical protein DRG11_03970 [Campylobacterota bacterium]